MYQKIQSLLDDDPVIGYDASGKVIKKSQFVADIREAEVQIARGEYLTIEHLKTRSVRRNR
ncbi:MAG: hypothetical protein KAR19_08780 [Bacteroidales bacterium]|nr:hypothetical protein [Bacteroidales bacterium]